MAHVTAHHAPDIPGPETGGDGDGTARPGAAATTSAAEAPRLVLEALSASGLLWIEVPGDRAWPAWHVLAGRSAYVVSGPGEQVLPDLPPRVRLVLRSKDTGGRLVSVEADTRRVTPGDADWAEATRALQASRLNAVGDLPQRWAATATVTALTPVPGTAVGPGGHPDGSGAAPPPTTAATTRGRQPWHFRGRPARRRRAR